MELVGDQKHLCSSSLRVRLETRLGRQERMIDLKNCNLGHARTKALNLESCIVLDRRST
jgi:hypothetical protein